MRHLAVFSVAGTRMNSVSMILAGEGALRGRDHDPRAEGNTHEPLILAAATT